MLRIGRGARIADSRAAGLSLVLGGSACRSAITGDASSQAADLKIAHIEGGSCPPGLSATVRIRHFGLHYCCNSVLLER